MFRSMFRVVVVAIVVLAFVVTSIPAYAAPQGKAATKVESGWFDSMIAWAGQLINGIRPPKMTTTSSKVTPLNGSCIDPLGRCV